MSGEPYPVVEGVIPEAIFLDDGSLNEAVLRQRFGIGADEAAQEVTFSSYQGTVAQMLADEKCPVGGMVESAYREHGIAGVEEKFKQLGQMDPRFEIKISPATLAREQVKKK